MISMNPGLDSGGAVHNFLSWLAVERGRSANTVRTYARTLRTLPGDPLTITREDVEQWWRDQGRDDDGNPRPHSSRNNELSAVRSFYKWAQRFEHRADDPTVRIDQLRQQKRESRFVGAADLHRLLDTLPPDMRRAVALGAYGGLRVSEVAVLAWRDIDIDSRRMIVRGKGDKERRVGIPVDLLDLLLPNTGGNVVTGTNEAYTGHYLQMKVNIAMKARGVTETFHGLRHRFGYMAASGGAKPTSIARAMGHENLTTTMRYIAAMDTDLDFIADAVTRR